MERINHILIWVTIITCFGAAYDCWTGEQEKFAPVFILIGVVGGWWSLREHRQLQEWLKHGGYDKNGNPD